MLKHCVFPFCLVLASGCLEPSVTSTGSALQGVNADVRGTQINHHVFDTGEMFKAIDLSDTLVAAFVQDESGQFVTYPGTGYADGSFTIPNVPERFFTLQVGARYFVTDARQIDLGTSVIGRPDVVRPTISPSKIVLNLDGLRPWRSTESHILLPRSSIYALCVGFELAYAA